MTDRYFPENLAMRQRKLDELFADQPYLSPTMMASRMHERLADEPLPPPFPVLSSADDEVLQRLIEGRRSRLVASMPPAPAEPEAAVRTPLPIPSGDTLRMAPEKAGTIPGKGSVRLELLMDLSVSPPKVCILPGGEGRDPEVMTATEAAKLLRVSPSTVRAWVAEKQLPCARLGHRLRFRREALLGWLAMHEQCRR